MLLWTWLYKYLFKSLLSIFLTVCLEVELLDNMVIFWRTARLVSTTTALFTFPPAYTRVLISSHLHQHLFPSSFLPPFLPPAFPFLDVHFSYSVVSDSFQPHGMQHTRLPCPSPTPAACSNSCPSSWWCHPNISSSVIPFSSCLEHEGLFQWVSS